MSEKIGGEEVPNSTRELDVDGEIDLMVEDLDLWYGCLLYTSPSPRDRQKSRMPSSA